MRRLFFILATLVFPLSVLAAPKYGAEEMKYRRNSVYSILVNHTEQKFSGDILREFNNIPVPDRYNDHTLSVTGLSVDNATDHSGEIDDYIVRNKLASRMVARWFNRDPRTGVCDMELIKARGLYDATAFDKELALHDIRGMRMLQDAGEELIGNTFLLVNEIIYVDKSQSSRTAGAILAALGMVAGIVAAAATNDDSWKAVGTGAGALVGATVASYKGFSVRIISRLYQLEWSEEDAAIFYTKHYTEVPDPEKKEAFENDRDMFRLKYIGKVISKGNQTSFLGINEEHPQIMVRKACQRAIDENVVDLQRAYEQFRVKSPVASISPTINIPIGKKEGVSKDSRYEVLEASEENGRITYSRVGIIEPVPSMIWDNRFMAEEEGAEGADLGTTTFRKVSGKEFYPGMLIREII